jgi:hypothetical protein
VLPEHGRSWYRLAEVLERSVRRTVSCRYRRRLVMIVEKWKVLLRVFNFVLHFRKVEVLMLFSQAPEKQMSTLAGIIEKYF